MSEHVSKREYVFLCRESVCPFCSSLRRAFSPPRHVFVCIRFPPKNKAHIAVLCLVSPRNS